MPRKKTFADHVGKAVEQTAPNAQISAAQESEATVTGRLDRDFLQTLSTDALLKLAEDMDVPIQDPEDREALIDLIAGGEVIAPAAADGESGEPPELNAQIPPPETESERATLYKATVLPALLVVRRNPDGPVVGTLSSGTEVTVTGSRNGYAQMNNGLFIRESHIKPL